MSVPRRERSSTRLPAYTASWARKPSHFGSAAPPGVQGGVVHGYGQHRFGQGQVGVIAVQPVSGGWLSWGRLRGPAPAPEYVEQRDFGLVALP